LEHTCSYFLPLEYIYGCKGSKVKASNGWVASFDVDGGEGCYFVWSYCCHCPCNLGSIVLTVEGIMD
jgi:hypothetical protein